jgi:hypothetical protein
VPESQRKIARAAAYDIDLVRSLEPFRVAFSRDETQNDQPSPANHDSSTSTSIIAVLKSVRTGPAKRGSASIAYSIRCGNRCKSPQAAGSRINANQAFANAFCQTKLY